MCALLQTRYFFLPHDYRQIFVAPKQIVSSHAKEKKGKKKKNLSAFLKPHWPSRPLRLPKGEKEQKTSPAFRNCFWRLHFLKKSGNNVNVFSLGTIVRTFNRVINHCSPAFAALGRLSILQTTRQNHKHGKNFSGAAVFYSVLLFFITPRAPKSWISFVAIFVMKINIFVAKTNRRKVKKILEK